MKHCVVTDSGFLIAVVDETDTFFKDAIFIFRKILAKKDKVKIVIPPLAMYELIVTLRRKGFTPRKVEGIVSRFLHMKNTMLLSITETSAMKHCSRLMVPGSQANALRTADFMIASVGLDFEAQILTFDRKVLDKIKPIHPSIYYCSGVGGFTDETGDFIAELDKLTK